MSKIKTGQIIFRRVKGRIIPIFAKGKNPIVEAQKRAASRLIKAGKATKPQGFIKKKAQRRWKLISNWSQRKFKRGKVGNIIMPMKSGSVFPHKKYPRKMLGIFTKEAQNERKLYTTLQYTPRKPIKFDIFGTQTYVVAKTPKGVKRKAVRALRSFRGSTTTAQRRRVIEDLRKLKSR